MRQSPTTTSCSRRVSRNILFLPSIRRRSDLSLAGDHRELGSCRRVTACGGRAFPAITFAALALASTGLFRTGFLLHRLLIARTPVIGDVEARALKEQSSTCSQQSLHFPLSPGLKATKLFWTDRVGFVLHRLKRFNCLVALLATILVGRHILLWDIAEVRQLGNAWHPNREGAPHFELLDVLEQGIY